MHVETINLLHEMPFMNTLLSLLRSLFGRSATCASEAEAKSNASVRNTCIELEGARSRFEHASRRVAVLKQHLEQSRQEGNHNKGYLSLIQRDLQLAARKAQSAYDDAMRLQDGLELLESVAAGRARIARTVPVSREELDNLLREVAVAQSRAEQRCEITAELEEAVYGQRNLGVEEMEILHAVTGGNNSPTQLASEQMAGVTTLTSA